MFTFVSGCVGESYERAISGVAVPPKLWPYSDSTLSEESKPEEKMTEQWIALPNLSSSYALLR
jgi:hypothetical protein